MKCSVFIATSADSYIATEDGGVEWLEGCGKPDADMGEQSDMGFGDYMASVDCMIMGRKTMEKISSFNLTPEQWPYGDTPIVVLSNTVKVAPDNISGKVEMYSGDIPALITRLGNEGFSHAYIDGGTAITSFLKLQLISEMTLTQAPLLLGSGRPLIGKTARPIKLQGAQVIAYPNDFVQIKYQVNYA
jgi:dihydrofolate reductase